MSREPELVECAECGAAIFNKRRHRRWHDRVYVTPDVAAPPAPPWIGEAPSAGERTAT